MTIVEQLGNQPWRDVRKWTLLTLMTKAALHTELYTKIRNGDPLGLNID